MRQGFNKPSKWASSYLWLLFSDIKAHSSSYSHHWLVLVLSSHLSLTRIPGFHPLIAGMISSCPHGSFPLYRQRPFTLILGFHPLNIGSYHLIAGSGRLFVTCRCPIGCATGCVREGSNIGVHCCVNFARA